LAGSNNPYPDAELAPVTVDVTAGDNRAEYARAQLEGGRITPFGKQDSGMIIPLVEANALLIRPVGSPPLKSGDMAQYLAL
jgi:molybdopterin molybdotransferase